MEALEKGACFFKRAGVKGVERLREECGTNGRRQIKRAFKLFYGREADDFEIATSLEMIEAEGLQAFCRALYNTSEFLFVF